MTTPSPRHRIANDNANVIAELPLQDLLTAADRCLAANDRAQAVKLIERVFSSLDLMENQ
jgi:hypothetical protein